MSETNPVPFDYVAVCPHGVYAICADVAGDKYVRRFIDQALRRGHSIERVPVAEAVERHKAYLKLHFSVALPSQPDPAGSSEGER